MATTPSAHNHDLDLEVALDFLNTLGYDDGIPHDDLVSAPEAATWLVDHGLLHPDQVVDWGERELEAVKAGRDALREVVDSVVQQRTPRPDAVMRVNDVLGKDAPAALEPAATGVAVGHRHSADPVAEGLARIATPIVTEIATGHPERFRICANDGCRWSFYDTSPTARRRWCSMRSCGNRAKAARHRERMRSSRIAVEPIRMLDSE